MVDDRNSQKSSHAVVDEKANVPVVAIGASAGGLEPFEQFFDAMQDHSGIAFVIIQHLSPNFQSMMDELLARHSNMKIERVIDGLELEPNTIYLNPPRSEMSLRNGHFKLTAFSSEKMLNMPIDTFFESLAAEVGHNAIAIVLSGTGSDGTKGAAAIKDVGGTVLAQDLATAKFDGMPGSVIKMGYADAVGYPAALAEFVGRIMRGEALENDAVKTINEDPVTEIFRKLRERFGTEFSYYKTATIQRRLERRANMRSMSLKDYAKALTAEPDEIDALYGDLLIEVTAFFRDREAYDVLNKQVVPQLVTRMSHTRPLRIWVPGCASGEEAYSLAILFAEHAREHDLELNLKILATDIHHRSLDAASAGIYPSDSLQGLTDEQVERYFERDGSYFQVKQHLRRMVVFSPHNILKDPPFTRMDLVSCRNVLIYFNDVAQQKTLALFHFALTKGGYLFLGPSEATGKLENEFETVGQRWRIFKKKRDVRLLEATTLLPSDGGGENIFDRSQLRSGVAATGPTPVVPGPIRQAHNEALKELLRLYAPPGFLLTKSGDIVHVFGDAGMFLRVESGVFSNKIVDLVDDDLKLIIGTGIERLKASEKITFERRIAAVNDELGNHSIVIKLKPLIESGNVSSHLLLTLERTELQIETNDLADVKPLQASEATEILRGRIADLERDLHGTEESLQSTIEELETSNEELQATNEELMASNEELQSTNEELHSVNEELYTVSSEHQRKIEELTESTDDMDHLLKATNIGIIFLDDQLRIRRFTPSATETFNLMYQDIGRPIEHLTYKFEQIDLAAAIEKVRKSGQTFEQEIQVGERYFSLRILPYRASLQEVVGAVVTTIDISDIKEAEEARIETTRRYESIVGDLTDFIVRWVPETGKVTYCNQPFVKLTGATSDEIVGSDIHLIDGKLGDRAFFADLAKGNQDTDFDNATLAFDPSGEAIVVSGTFTCVSDDEGKTIAHQCTGHVVTAQFRYRQALERLWELQDEASEMSGRSFSDILNFDEGFFDVANGKDAPVEELPLEKLLEIGCDYLKMERGIFSYVEGDDYHVIEAIGFPESELSCCQVLKTSETYCGQMLSQDTVFAIEHWGASALAQEPCYLKYGLEAYCGVTISGVSGVTCVLSFYAKAPRASVFTPDEKLFVQYLAQMLGSLLNRQNYLSGMKKRQRHYQDLYQQSPIMMCTVDEQAHVLEVNEEWLSSLGFNKQDVVGKDVRNFMADSGSKVLWKGFPKISKSAKSYRKKPITLVTSEADKINVELSAIRHQMAGSKEERYLIGFEDVTDRNLAFAEVERQRNELQEANEGLNTFAYVASHDLQEPLRKIRQFAEILGDEYGDKFDEEGEYFLNIVTSSAARISSLVRDILDYSMATSSDLLLEEVDLKEVVVQAKTVLSDKIEAKQAVVNVKDLPKVIGDATALRQVIENLLSNAIKYTDDDVIPSVTISVREVGLKTIVEIADNGIGIKPAPESDIFSPFTRLHDKRKYPGSGLGLAICKTVCERLGWQISHKDRKGGGTVFSLAIPQNDT